MNSNDINTVKQCAKATIFISSANPVKTCWFPPQHEKELCQLKVNLGRKMTFWLQYLERRCSDNIPTVFSINVPNVSSRNVRWFKQLQILLTLYFRDLICLSKENTSPLLCRKTNFYQKLQSGSQSFL